MKKPMKQNVTGILLLNEYRLKLEDKIRCIAGGISCLKSLSNQTVLSTSSGSKHGLTSVIDRNKSIQYY